MSHAVTSKVMTATGVAVTGPCVVKSFHLVAGSDTATATIRDGNPLGPIRAVLSAATLTSDDYTVECGIRFTDQCYVVITGTAPSLSIAVVNPQANQV